MCQSCKQTSEIRELNFLKPNTIDNCNTSLEFLNSLNNLITLNVTRENLNQEDVHLLQIYKGQVLSAISLTNYCYTNFQIVETSVYNVISKYN